MSTAMAALWPLKRWLALLCPCRISRSCTLVQPSLSVPGLIWQPPSGFSSPSCASNRSSKAAAAAIASPCSAGAAFACSAQPRSRRASCTIAVNHCSRCAWRSRRNVVSETLAAAGVVENCEPKVQGAVGKPFFGFSTAPSVFHNAFRAETCVTLSLRTQARIKTPQVSPWGSRTHAHQPTWLRSKSMSTGSNKSLPLSPVRQSEKSEIEKLLQAGLSDFSLRELLGALLSSLAHAERGAYLQNQLDDKANGFYPRSLQLGSVPVEMEVPRTRSGQFRPPSLPARYQRGYSEETQSLLLGLLSSSRSVAAAREALHKMGLSNSEQELEKIAAGFIEELELRNTRPLDPDLLALFFDGKYVEIREGDRLKPACIYLVVGLGREGKKRVLACLAKSGRENLEDWKLVLRSLLERGLRRVLIIV